MLAQFFRSKANQLLGGAMLTLTIIMFFGWAETDESIMMMLSELMWEFLFPAFLFHYFVVAVHHPYKKGAWINALYLPFFISVIVKIVFDLSFKLQFYTLPFGEEGAFVMGYKYLEYNVSFFYGLGLVLWAAKLVWRTESLPQERQKWLKQLVLFVGVLYGVWLLTENLEEVISEKIWNVLWGGISLFFLSMIYFGVYQLRLVEQKDEIHALLKQEANDGAAKSRRRTQNKYMIQLEAIMQEDELFRNPDLNREVLSEKMGISSGYVTQVIKEASGMGFVEYINEQRVMAARQMLSNPVFDKYSLQAIGMEAGFKSRSSFYSTFQKLTGKTPGEFKKERKLS